MDIGVPVNEHSTCVSFERRSIAVAPPALALPPDLAGAFDFEVQ